MTGVFERTHLVGVANFAQAKPEIDNYGCNILRNFAGSFTINPKAVAELNNLPKILSEVCVPAFYGTLKVLFLRLMEVWTD